MACFFLILLPIIVVEHFLNYILLFYRRAACTFIDAFSRKSDICTYSATQKFTSTQKFLNSHVLNRPIKVLAA